VAGILIIVIGIWSHAASQPQTPQNPQVENRIAEIEKRAKEDKRPPEVNIDQLPEPLFSVNRDLVTPGQPLKLPPEDGLVAAVRVGHLSSVSFSPDGKYLAVGSRLIQTATSQSHILPSVRSPFAFSRDSELLIAELMDSDGMAESIVVLSTSRPIPSPNPLEKHTLKPRTTLVKLSRLKGCGGADFSADGRFLAAVVQEAQNDHEQVTSKLLLWKCSTFEDEPKILLTSRQFPIGSPIFSRDSQTIAVAMRRQQDGVGIQIVDIGTGQEKAWLKAKERTNNPGIGFLVYSPDGAILASANSDGSATLWDTRTNQERLTLSGQRGRLGRIAFSPQGTIVATCDAFGVCWLWDVKTGQKLCECGKDDGSGRSYEVLGFSPDGRLVITATGDLLKAWDVAKLTRR
jgi:WD40 repeat protein